MVEVTAGYSACPTSEKSVRCAIEAPSGSEVDHVHAVPQSGTGTGPDLKDELPLEADPVLDRSRYRWGAR